MKITALLLFIAIVCILLFVKKPIAKELSEKEINFKKNQFIIRNKEKFTKLTIQKAQQNIDNYLKQKDSIASTIES